MAGMNIRALKSFDESTELHFLAMELEKRREELLKSKSMILFGENGNHQNAGECDKVSLAFGFIGDVILSQKTYFIVCSQFPLCRTRVLDFLV